MVVQSTSPYAAPRAFWCVELTLRDAGYTTFPYHCWVPSFGDWGYVLALPTARPAPARLREGASGLRFLDQPTLEALFRFPPDQRPPEGLRPNLLHEQVLVHYHEEDWRAASGE
jgi:spermidine synthase